VGIGGGGRIFSHQFVDIADLSDAIERGGAADVAAGTGVRRL
jgi:hypothetical protein